MATFVYTPDGLMNKTTGQITPFNRSAPPVLPGIDTSDDQEPLQSMADGKWYTSKAKMRESYKASNNPKGKTFEEVGNDPSFLNHSHKPLKADKREFLEAVEKAEAAISRGEIQ